MFVSTSNPVRPVVAVVTSVHWPDDTRIRERLIRTLSSEFDVLYAARTPGPTDSSGLVWVELKGGRIRRNLAAIRFGLTGKWQVMVVHDPELLVCAILARLVRRRPVVFDVHEDVPASAYTRSWAPRWARKPLSVTMAVLLRIAERLLKVTLAEAGYQHLFKRTHPVFPNYPDTADYPNAAGQGDGPVVYLGDVTLERGADTATAACATLGVPLRLIGRVAPETRRELTSHGDGVIFEGVLPNRAALSLVAESSVGLAPLRDLPNYRNSQPTKVLEYLAVGIPVVASDLAGTRELVEGLDAVFLVAPGDSDELAAAISQARSPDVRELARAQVATIRSRFRWPAEDVVGFYRSLL